MGWVAAGHQVDVLLLRYSQSADYALDPLVKVTSLNFTKRGFRLAAMRRIRLAFREADVVYSMLDMANLVCALYKPQKSAPLIWGLRASNTASGWMGESVLALMRLLQSKARTIIANASAVEKYYRSRGLDKQSYQIYQTVCSYRRLRWTTTRRLLKTSHCKRPMPKPYCDTV